MTISLKNLVVSHKETQIEFPGMPGFLVSISHLSRETLQKLRKKATTTKYKNRQPVEDLDDDLFLQLYSEACVTGWTGLKLKYLEQLLPVDLKDIEDLEQELPYTPEDALNLMKGSINFDQFVSESVTDLGNFTTNK